MLQAENIITMNTNSYNKDKKPKIYLGFFIALGKKYL